MAPDPLLQQRRFRNTYWLLRHGRSAANEQDLIVSRPQEGEKPEWGLTAEGRAQATAAGQRLRQMLGDEQGGWDPATLLVLASPFSRTVQTALEAGAALGVGEGDTRLQVGGLVGGELLHVPVPMLSAQCWALHGDCSRCLCRCLFPPNQPPLHVNGLCPLPAPAAGACAAGALFW